MYCSKCGTQNNDENLKCTQCGQVLRTATPTTTGSDGLNSIIPYKNSKALTAYYLGVFSIIPCLGAPLGIAAFVLGLGGLKYAKEHPEAKGKTHAWVGILVGGFFGFIYTLWAIVTIGSMITSSMLHH
jgi:hypothetical protein